MHAQRGDRSLRKQESKEVRELRADEQPSGTYEHKKPQASGDAVASGKSQTDEALHEVEKGHMDSKRSTW